MNNPSNGHLNWGAEALWQELEPLLPGLSIEVLARCGSTNTELLERLRHSQEEQGNRGQARRSHDLQPCLLVAEHQTQGRGRMGRNWVASPGASLTFSVAIPMALEASAGLSLAVGTVLADALESPREGALHLGLKWPNDLWLDGRKLGGILIETVPAGASRMVIVGVGLNVLAEGKPAEGHGFATGYASLDELYPGVDAPRALALVARPLIALLAGYATQGLVPWLAAYQRRDLLRGQLITAGTLEGLGAGVNAQGELLLQTGSGAPTVVSGGEVTVRFAPSESSKDPN
ncbi:biotin--[acetyl-CoA-carboxylase] ligase [Pelomonas sp. SE-A7]|uniref:biotin--[acetyl-CoA-carboxylase] ligase n=1 Tax=Pelomonas sp. SE-A7 TaxID=3054953 RepID=UPI00259CC00B|nr:biotin--[acetyl-CoA-carboxylase] ligase [Pelomonas sp. SE-A7]MDM4766894.1 biotin--[acetyl-CoA-carboxylase] ligase [Pelomonas sp. SE-A7]